MLEWSSIRVLWFSRARKNSNISKSFSFSFPNFRKRQTWNLNHQLIYDFLLFFFSLFSLVVQEFVIRPIGPVFHMNFTEKRSKSQITAYFVVQMFLYIFILNSLNSKCACTKTRYLNFYLSLNFVCRIQTESNSSPFCRFCFHLKMHIVSKSNIQSQGWPSLRALSSTMDCMHRKENAIQIDLFQCTKNKCLCLCMPTLYFSNHKLGGNWMVFHLSFARIFLRMEIGCVGWNLIYVT